MVEKSRQDKKKFWREEFHSSVKSRHLCSPFSFPFCFVLNYLALCSFRVSPLTIPTRSQIPQIRNQLAWQRLVILKRYSENGLPGKPPSRKYYCGPSLVVTGEVAGTKVMGRPSM